MGPKGHVQLEPVSHVAVPSPRPALTKTGNPGLETPESRGSTEPQGTAQGESQTGPYKNTAAPELLTQPTPRFRSTFTKLVISPQPRHPQGCHATITKGDNPMHTTSTTAVRARAGAAACGRNLQKRSLQAYRREISYEPGSQRRHQGALARLYIPNLTSCSLYYTIGTCSHSCRL